MGLIKKQEPINVDYISIDNNEGMFVDKNREHYTGIEGTLLGFNQHSFEFRGKDQYKFDVFISDEGKNYDVQFGKYAHVTFKLLNTLMSIEKFKQSEILIELKYEDDNYSIFVKYQGNYLKWKYKWAELGLNDENRDQKIHDLIDEWTDFLINKMPMNPKLLPKVENVKDNKQYKKEDYDDVPF